VEKQHRFLVAVDGSDNSTRALRYTGERLAGKDDMEITLLYIERMPERDLFADDERWRATCQNLGQRMRAYLEEARQALLCYGIPAACLDVKYVESCNSPFLKDSAGSCSLGSSIAREILDVLQREGYGTVVLGRRGVSKAEEFLFGSVSNRIIHHAKDCTIWIVA